MLIFFITASETTLKLTFMTMAEILALEKSQVNKVFGR